MAAGINHDQQRRADGQRRERARARVNDRHADGEEEKECANEFNEIFFHRMKSASISGQTTPGPPVFASEKFRSPISGIHFGMDDWGERARPACWFGRRARTMGCIIQFGRGGFRRDAKNGNRDGRASHPPPHDHGGQSP